MSRSFKLAAAALLIVCLCIGAGFMLVANPGAIFPNPFEETDPVVASPEPVVTVLDFAEPFPLEPAPVGWHHRKFLMAPAMELSIATKEGTPALRCETNAGGSIFSRYTDIPLAEFPILAWRWFVEVPIESATDERTEEGDDHPVRLFIRFRTATGEFRALEIIWSNREFAPGEYKYIGTFPHYVANGHDENVGRWHDEQVDLLAIYRTISKRDDSPKLSSIGIFCDSDNTGTRSVAYVANVRLKKSADTPDP